MKSQSILGPYFSATHTATLAPRPIEPLEICIEWASPTEARTLPLSCHHPPHALHRSRRAERWVDKLVPGKVRWKPLKLGEGTRQERGYYVADLEQWLE